MKIEEINRFKEFYDQFENDCNRVASILSGIKKKWCGCDSAYAETFTIDDDNVMWEGDEYWNYGGHEHHSGNFPIEYLAMTDDELKEIVEKENEKYDEEVRAKKAIEEARETEARHKKYEELKKEFGE